MTTEERAKRIKFILQKRKEGLAYHDIAHLPEINLSPERVRQIVIYAEYAKNKEKDTLTT